MIQGLWFAVVFLCTTASGALASDIHGQVVRIADGDTLTLLTPDKQQIRVRLTEIDAPEKNQAFGNRSRQALSDNCFNKQAILTDTDKDHYGRTLARVSCDGVDANSEMIRRGLAWVFDKYVRDRSLYRLQEQAKSKRAGLWYDENPVPTWQFRKRKK